MDSTVQKILKQYKKQMQDHKQYVTENFEELYNRFIEIIDHDGFRALVEHFVKNRGFTERAEIDEKIGAVSGDFMAMRILEGMEPGPELTREGLAYAMYMLGVPVESREIIQELADIAVKISFGSAVSM